jgi:HNH/ENDO VII superfamily nuclease with conserved GHE residues
MYGGSAREIGAAAQLEDSLLAIAAGRMVSRGSVQPWSPAAAPRSSWSFGTPRAGEGVAGKAVSYARPSGYRVGVRDQVWNDAIKVSPDGLVRDPLTGRVMSQSEPWDMGHLSGHEFRRIQAESQAAGISRQQFLDIHNDPKIYRPELPSSNRSHALEDMSDHF